MSENERIESRRRTHVDSDQTHPANPGHSPGPIYIENRR